MTADTVNNRYLTVWNMLNATMTLSLRDISTTVFKTCAVNKIKLASCYCPLPAILHACMSETLWLYCIRQKLQCQRQGSMDSCCIMYKAVFMNGMSRVILGHPSRNMHLIWLAVEYNPDSKIHGANMGPTWVLSPPDGPHVGSMNLAINPRTRLALCSG